MTMAATKELPPVGDAEGEPIGESVGESVGLLVSMLDGAAEEGK
jgi:hypothetical protein